MNIGRILILGVALLAAGGAAMLVGRGKPPAEAAAPPALRMDMTEVLVATRTLDVGQKVAFEDLRWQAWPRDAVAGVFIDKETNPSGLEDMVGTVARAVVFEGEPATGQKLVRADGAGFMAASLTPGMRAVSVPVTEETGAGGFILPNDRVDVIVSYKEAADMTGGQQAFSRTILTDVRVLAVGATMRDAPQPAAEGETPPEGDTANIAAKTATLEVSPIEAELVQLAATQGTITLTLRGLAMADAPAPAPRVPGAAGDSRPRGQSVTIVRAGRKTQTDAGAGR